MNILARHKGRTLHVVTSVRFPGAVAGFLALAVAGAGAPSSFVGRVSAQALGF
jgi:hypothetical protein